MVRDVRGPTNAILLRTLRSFTIYIKAMDHTSMVEYNFVPPLEKLIKFSTKQKKNSCFYDLVIGYYLLIFTDACLFEKIKKFFRYVPNVFTT